MTLWGHSYILVWCPPDVLWLMWLFTDPPDNPSDENPTSLSTQSPQMKSYMKRYWRGCVSSTPTMICLDYCTCTPQQVLSCFSLSFFLKTAKSESARIAEQRSLWWFKSGPAFESCYQFCLFLVFWTLRIDPPIEPKGMRLLCFVIVWSNITSLSAYDSWAAMWVRVTCLSCQVALDATWSLQCTSGKIICFWECNLSGASPAACYW